MRQLLKDITFFKAFFLFILLNISIYLFITLFYSSITFHKENYFLNSHHYFDDPRVEGRSFNLIESLGVYDAQWYLKIADSNYPKNPNFLDQTNLFEMQSLTYAFFPLYPLIIAILTQIFQSVEISAFIITNILLILNFISLYYVISKWKDKIVALKTCFLLFFFPLSIFFRSYYTEGLYLFLFIWFSYFLLKNHFIKTALFLGLMNITRGNGILLNFLFLFFLYQDFKQKGFSFKKLISIFLLLFFPLLCWFTLNYLQTGNFLHFANVQSNWFYSTNIFQPILHNLKLIFSWPILPFHAFHYSKLEVIMIITTTGFVLFSKNYLPNRLWQITLTLWIFPLIIKDLMSFSRFLIFIFPIFLYLASLLSSKYFVILTIAFYSLLLITSLYFINWYWVG